jgi:hypothetical protein
MKRRLPARLACDRFGMVCLAVCSLLVVSQTVSAEPVIRNLNLRGLQAGATTTLIVDGADLLPEPKLLLNVPIASQKVLDGATATRVQVEVTLDGQVTPGVYNLRVANPTGISPPEIVAIDRLPQLAFAEQIEALPVTMHGNLGGSQVLRTKFTGKAEQTVMIEIEAQRLGSKLRPVIHLLDANRKQLAYAWSSLAQHSDARLVAKLPADGEYTIELHDTLYGVPGPGFFRLKVGNWESADLAFPAAVSRGQTGNISLLSQTSSTAAVPVSFGEGPIWQPVPWPTGSTALFSGLRPKVLVSEVPEVQEAAQQGGTLQELSLAPVAVSGRLAVAGEEDRYRLSLSPGAKVRLETFAQRLGAAIDTEIELQNDQGARLAINDDGVGTNSGDSLLEYTAPAEATSVVVVVRDIHQRGGEANIYRLAVTPLDQNTTRDFRLIVPQDRQQISFGMQAVLPVLVERNGYEGAIRLSVDGLPSGVQLAGETIAAGATGTLLTFTGGPSDPMSAGVQSVVQVRGVAVDLPQPLSRLAEFETHPLAKLQPWMAQELGLSVSTASPQALQVNWEMPADFTLPLGAKLTLPVKFARAVADGGPVRVTLLTSQNMPRVNGNPDLGKALRQENANLEVVVDPTAKAAEDALQAAIKVVTDAEQKHTAALAAATQADVQALAVVNAATEKLTPLEKSLVDANVALKTSDDAKAAADLAVTTAQAAVTTAADQGEEAKTKAATDLAAAQAVAASAAAQQVQATTVMQTALAAQVAAAKVLEDAKTAAATTKTTGEQTVAAALQVVTAAVTARDAAQVAATKAATDAKYESIVSTIVPGTLPERTYDVAFRLELLAADRVRVLNTVYTPVKQVATLNPLVVKLAGELNHTITLHAQTPPMLKLTGTIERLAGMKSATTLTFEGLPAGVAVPSVVVPPDKTDFELVLTFPPNTAVGEAKAIKLFATGPMDVGTGEIIRSQNTLLNMNVLPAPAP